MAVAFDAVTTGSATDSALTISHTPVGTPRGVLVLVPMGLDGTDVITTATYGGIAVPEIAGSPNLKAAAEALGVHAFFRGAGIPTGAQNCVIAATGSEVITGAVITVTANDDTEVVSTNSAINSDSTANPSVTLVPGRTSFVAIAFGSGQNATTGITPLAGWTSIAEAALGGTATVAIYRYDTIDSASLTVGWTQTAEDAVGFAVAVSEIPRDVWVRPLTVRTPLVAR